MYARMCYAYMKKFLFTLIVFSYLMMCLPDLVAQDVFYCRQYKLTVSDHLTVDEVFCYESKVSVTYKKDRVTIVTDSLTITAQKLDRHLYIVDGDLYVFKDMYRSDGSRVIALMPIRFNNKFTIKEKQAIEISTNKICL